MFSQIGTLNPVTNQVEQIPPTINFDCYLSKMVGKEHHERIRYIEKDSFDPVFWDTLTDQGPAAYHGLIKNEFKPGCLWVQEDTYKEVAVHWTDEPGWINRAYLSTDRNITVESFMSNNFTTQSTKKKMTIKEFQKLIEDYLTRIPKSFEESKFSLSSFQKKLELAPIVCRITQAACEKLSQIRAECSYGFNVSLYIGANNSENACFNPLKNKGILLLRVSNYFFNGRLPFIHEMEGKPKETSEPVAPIIRSWEALHQIQGLRSMTSCIQVSDFDSERFVPNLYSVDKKTYEILKDRNLESLQACLIIEEGYDVELYQFKKQVSEKSDSKEGFEFSIDYDKRWKLQSKFFVKV